MSELCAIQFQNTRRKYLNSRPCYLWSVSMNFFRLPYVHVISSYSSSDYYGKNWILTSSKWSEGKLSDSQNWKNRLSLDLVCCQLKFPSLAQSQEGKKKKKKKKVAIWKEDDVSTNIFWMFNQSWLLGNQHPIQRSKPS